MKFLEVTGISPDVLHTRFRARIKPSSVLLFGDATEDLTKIGAASFIDTITGRVMVEETIHEIQAALEKIPDRDAE